MAYFPARARGAVATCVSARGHVGASVAASPSPRQARRPKCRAWRRQRRHFSDSASRTCPLLSRPIMLRAVRLIQPRNLRHQRIVRVGIRQQRAHREQHLGDGQGGAPLALQNVKANAPVIVHVAVVDLRRELNLGMSEGQLTPAHQLRGVQDAGGLQTFGGLNG